MRIRFFCLGVVFHAGLSMTLLMLEKDYHSGAVAGVMMMLVSAGAAFGDYLLSPPAPER